MKNCYNLNHRNYNCFVIGSNAWFFSDDLKKQKIDIIENDGKSTTSPNFEEKVESKPLQDLPLSKDTGIFLHIFLLILKRNQSILGKEKSNESRPLYTNGPNQEIRF